MKKENIKPATFTFEFVQNAQDPKVYTATYFRNGVETDCIKDSSYIMCSAVMERRMRLAVFE